MSYNNGSFSLFNQGVTISNLYADSQTPRFNPPSGVQDVFVSAKSIAGTLLTSSSGTISSVYCQRLAGTIAAGSSISIAYGLRIAGPLVTAGTVSNAYSLFVNAPTILGGKIPNPVGGYFALPTVGVNMGGVGIATTTPMNSLDVSGAVAVGAFGGGASLNFGVLAVSGAYTTTQAVGVQTANPQQYLDVAGTIEAGSAYGWMPFGTQQEVILSQGNQGSAGFGSVGTNQNISVNTTSLFDMTTVNSALGGYNNAVFDGRYIYYIPRFNNTLVFFGIVLRYDTSLPFGMSTSYTLFDLAANVNINCVSLSGIFDGRYIYLGSGYGFGVVPLTYLTRYDTTLPFNCSSSYLAFNVATISSDPTAFIAGVFDGRYVYFSSGYSGFSSANKTSWFRYDTNSSFVSSLSYSFFDLVNITSVRTNGAYANIGIFDGRYVYLLPSTTGTVSALMSRYDTTLPFSVSTSYTTFDLLKLPNNVTNQYSRGEFDGRYFYLSPSTSSSSGGAFSSQLWRYDTTLSFTSTVSYSLFNAIALNTLAPGLEACCFDGRFVYYSSSTFPQIFGLIISYDTTQPWGMTTSYTTFDFAILNSLATGVRQAIHAGGFIYFVPVLNNIIVRTTAYPGAPMSSMSIASQALNGFMLGNGITNPITSGTALAGGLSIPSQPSGYLVFIGGRGGVTKIPYF